MIGNSFSVDVAHFTHQLSLGSDLEIEVGVLYVGGCSLQMHADYLKKEITPYEWFVNGVSSNRYIDLKTALLMKKWDYISLQQVSYNSGRKETFYPFINELIDFVKKYQNIPHFILHKTWPYQGGFNNDNFAYYHYDREEMYKAINETYDYVKNDLKIDTVIRSGDIIESAIEKYGEYFHIDGFHLNEDGRYLVALGFVHTFNNNEMINNLFVPDGFSKDKCYEYEKLVNVILNN